MLSYWCFSLCSPVRNFGRRGLIKPSLLFLCQRSTRNNLSAKVCFSLLVQNIMGGLLCPVAPFDCLAFLHWAPKPQVPAPLSWSALGMFSGVVVGEDPGMTLMRSQPPCSVRPAKLCRTFGYPRLHSCSPMALCVGGDFPSTKKERKVGEGGIPLHLEQSWELMCLQNQRMKGSS